MYLAGGKDIYMHQRAYKELVGEAEEGKQTAVWGRQKQQWGSLG